MLGYKPPGVNKNYGACFFLACFLVSAVGTFLWTTLLGQAIIQQCDTGFLLVSGLIELVCVVNTLDCWFRFLIFLDAVCEENKDT